MNSMNFIIYRTAHRERYQIKQRMRKIEAATRRLCEMREVQQYKQQHQQITTAVAAAMRLSKGAKRSESQETKKRRKTQMR